jgi:GT2 family glycosyltransferase
LGGELAEALPVQGNTPLSEVVSCGHLSCVPVDTGAGEREYMTRSRSGGLPPVCVIVLVWNEIEDTLECLASLAQQTYPNMQIVVVDNGSEPPLDPAAFEQWPGVRLIRNKRNLGYAGGNNVAIRAALREGFDYVFLANNDTTFEPHMMEKLVAVCEEDPSVGIAGPTILDFEEPDRVVNRGCFLDRDTCHECQRDYGENRRAGSREVVSVDYVYGCGLLIRVSVLRMIGMLDEHFFLYIEEADLCCRVSDARLRVVCVTEAEMWHKDSRTMNRSPSLLKQYYMKRNRWLFLWKRGRRRRALGEAWRAFLLGCELTVHHWRRGQAVPGNVLVHRCAAEHFLRSRFGPAPETLVDLLRTPPHED